MTLRYTDQNRNVYDPLRSVLSKIHNLERIQDIQNLSLLLEIWIPAYRSRTGKVVRETDILRDFCLLCEAGVVSPEIFTLIKDPGGVTGRRCSYFQKDYGLRPYDVIALNLGLFPLGLVARDRLVRRAPWEFEDRLLEFKAAYCRKKGVECVFLHGEENWPVTQIVPEDESVT
jgi:hypothetical protein